MKTQHLEKATNGDSAAIELAPKTEEQEATERVLAARKRREEACRADFEALLERHKCGWTFRQVLDNGQTVQSAIIFVAK